MLQIELLLVAVVLVLLGLGGHGLACSLQVAEARMHVPVGLTRAAGTTAIDQRGAREWLYCSVILAQFLLQGIRLVSVFLCLPLRGFFCSLGHSLVLPVLHGDFDQLVELLAHLSILEDGYLGRFIDLVLRLLVFEYAEASPGLQYLAVALLDGPNQVVVAGPQVDILAFGCDFAPIALIRMALPGHFLCLVLQGVVDVSVDLSLLFRLVRRNGERKLSRVAGIVPRSHLPRQEGLPVRAPGLSGGLPSRSRQQRLLLHLVALALEMVVLHVLPEAGLAAGAAVHPSPFIDQVHVFLGFLSGDEPLKQHFVVLGQVGLAQVKSNS